VPLTNGYFVQPFPTEHSIPSQGYLVVSRKKKLKAEFVGAGKEAIISARKTGIEVSDVVEVQLGRLGAYGNLSPPQSFPWPFLFSVAAVDMAPR
jgi:hypothetical protein